MAVSIIGPKFYAWDSDTGKPLAFGKVYTYQAGTNTPKATFTTEGGETENANPVILNGAGYADIFLSGSYKIVVKDADDVEVWTSDPVSDPSQLQQEWVRQRNITQVNTTSFTVNGELTDEYVEGVAVRVKQDSGFVTGTVSTATYADGKTTVTLDFPGTESITTSAVYAERALVSFQSLPKNLGDRTIYVGSVAESFAGLAGVADAQYSAIAWASGGAVMTSPSGGGMFVYEPSRPKSDHNGGTVISPTVPPLSAQTDISNFLGGAGETDPSGNGCFVRLGVSVADPVIFGADDTGNSPSHVSWQAAADWAKDTYVPFEFKGNHLLRQQVVFGGRHDVRGHGIASSRIINEVPVTDSCLKFESTGTAIFPTNTYFTMSDFFIHDPTNTFGSGIHFGDSMSWAWLSNVMVIGGQVGLKYDKYCIGHFLVGCIIKSQAVAGILDSEKSSYAEHNVGLSIIGGNYEQSPICIDWKSADLSLSGQPIIEAYTVAGVRSTVTVRANSGYFEPIVGGTKAIDLVGGGVVGSCIQGCVFHLNNQIDTVGISYDNRVTIIGNEFGSDTASGTNSIQGPGTPTSSVIIGNILSTIDITGDTNTTYMTSATAQLQQILCTSFGRFGATPVQQIGSMEPQNTEEQKLGSATKRYLEVWSKRIYPQQISFAEVSSASGVTNNTLFVDSADNKLKFKDSGGVVNLLY